MNKLIQKLDKEIVKLDISGKKILKGTIVDSSSDLIVLYNGKDYYYISIPHIHELNIDYFNEEGIKVPSEIPELLSNEKKDGMTLEKVLSQAVGIYSEIYVLNNQYLHGYISNVMSDYFVFQSPIYKKMYIPIRHLKWLIPYNENQRPYGLSDIEFPVQKNDEQLSKTLKAQIEKLKNNLVVFNLGEKNNYSGRLKNINGQIVELQTATDTSILLNLLHIKTVHQV